MHSDPDTRFLLAKARIAETHAVAATDRLARDGARARATTHEPTRRPAPRPFDVIRRLAAAILA